MSKEEGGRAWGVKREGREEESQVRETAQSQEIRRERRLRTEEVEEQGERRDRDLEKLDHSLPKCQRKPKKEGAEERSHLKREITRGSPK